MKSLLSLSSALAAAAITSGCASSPQESDTVATAIVYDTDTIMRGKFYPTMEACLADGRNVFRIVAGDRYKAEMNNAMAEKGIFVRPTIVQICTKAKGAPQYNADILPN